MKRIFLLIVFFIFPSYTYSQHEGHQRHEEEDEPLPQEQVHKPHDEGEMQMPHSFSRNLPMNRNASGTSWLPDASPMFGYMLHRNEWMFMFHGQAFIRYNNQDVFGQGTRGGSQFDAPNWIMGMGQRYVGNRGLFRFSVMLSLDPVTVGGAGYPLLFQSGETWQGQPLVDRQHPHNFFSELSIGYTHMINEEADIFLYLAMPGEPALGPPAFMHRISTLSNPDAPLGHHWQDATHIVFGVATLGLRYNIFKLEGSVFTGREPGENRWGFDRPRFDSYAARFSVNPTRRLALQVSQAFITSPEVVRPLEDVWRTTASAIYAGHLEGENRFINTGLIWGYNNVTGEDHAEHSVLLESNLQLNRTSIYGRYEFVQKSSEELLILIVGHHDNFNINAVTLGANHVLFSQWNLNFALGAQATLNISPPELHMLYGKTPLAFQVYTRIFPGLMSRGFLR